jgi:hypothetical protein
VVDPSRKDHWEWETDAGTSGGRVALDNFGLSQIDRKDRISSDDPQSTMAVGLAD